MACRHPLNQRTGTELGHLAPCPALRTGRSAPRGRVPTATEKLVEGRKRPPPPATAPCSLHPLCQGTPSGGRWLVLFDFLGGTSRRPTPWLRICARKAGSQHRGEAVRCAWQGCASRSAEKSPMMSTPCPSCGVVAATQQGPHLFWVSFRNGLDVRMEGEGGMHRHPHFPVSVTVGTLFGQTDTALAVSLICVTNACFADNEPSHSLLRGHLPLCCNCS